MFRRYICHRQCNGYCYKINLQVTICKPIDIKLVFSTFKIKNSFNVKYSAPDSLRMHVVYKFS